MLEQGDGRTIDDWHETLLASFAAVIEVTDLNGKDRLAPQRTHTMDVKTMNDYITAIGAYFAEIGFPLPANI